MHFINLPMDLNQVNLTPELLTSLYQKVLVEESASKKGETPTQSGSGTSNESIRALGMHQRAILILVNEQQAPFLTDASLNYLTRILNACKLTMSDVALVNLANAAGANYLQLQEKYPSQLLIAFGIPPDALSLPIDFPPYQLQKLSGCTYLHAPSLTELELSETEKRKLWASLKKLFNI